MHVIFVVCDRLPLTMLGCYGSELAETPHLDGLAHRGAVFDAYFPERPSIDDCLRRTFADEADPSTAGGASLLKALAAQDVRTALFTDRLEATDGLLWLDDFESVTNLASSALPEADWASLEEVEACSEYRLPPNDHPAFERWTNRWRRQIGQERKLGDGAPRSVEAVFAAAIEWLAEHRADSTFLWLDFALAAGPWVPPREFRNRHGEEDAPAALCDPAPGVASELYNADELERIRAGWADRVGYFDRLFGAFSAGVEELDLANLFLVFTAGAGEPLGEHDRLGPMQGLLHTERVQAPLIVQWTGGRPASRRSEFVQSADFFTSIYALYHLGDASEGGYSLPAMLQGRSPLERWYVCISEGTTAAIQTRHWKLCRSEGGEATLFAKPEDRWDLADVASQHLEIVEGLQQELTSALNARGAWRPK